MLQEAVQAAKEADIVVLAIGEDRLQSGEATSNANIRIPEVQEALLDRIAEVNQNIVVVLLFVGDNYTFVSIDFWATYIPCIFVGILLAKIRLDRIKKKKG